MTHKPTRKVPKPAHKPRPARRPRAYEQADWGQKVTDCLTFIQGGQAVIEDAMRSARISPALWYKYQAMADAKLTAAHAKAEAKGHDDYMRFIKKKDRPYVEFVEQVRDARSSSKTIAAAEYRKREAGNWLRSIDAQNWGHKQNVTIGGDPEAPLIQGSGVILILPGNGRGPVPDAPPLQTPAKPEEKK